MNIIITVPKSIPWAQYEKELKAVENGDQVMNFKVPRLPKQASVGDRCYICYNGNVIGWMSIVGLVEKDFVCSTTGRHWKGNFVQRSGKFNKITPVPMKGFQGFRYYK